MYKKSRKQILMSRFAYLNRDMEENEMVNLFNPTDSVTEVEANVRARVKDCSVCPLPFLIK